MTNSTNTNSAGANSTGTSSTGTNGSSKPKNYRALKKRNRQLLLDDVHSKNQVFRGLPDFINFNHHEVCNLRCIMCFQAYTPGSRMIPSEQARAILDQVLPTASKLRLTTAGEPIHGDFEEIVDRVRHYQCALELITNATRLTPQKFHAMEDVLDHIIISLDSHEQKSLDHIRGKGTHKRIMKNLNDVNAYLGDRYRGFLLSYQWVLMTSNVPHLADFMKFAKGSQANMVRVARMHYMTEELHQNEDPFLNFSREELDQHIGAAQEEARRHGVNLLLDEVGYDSVHSEPIRDQIPTPIDTFACDILMHQTYIMPDQTVAPCCVPGDWNMGSLKTHTFQEIWNGKPYRKMRKQMFDQRLVGACANCKMYAPMPDDDAYDYLSVGQKPRFNPLERPMRMIRKRVDKILKNGSQK